MRFLYGSNGQQSPISMFLWMIFLAGLLLVSVSCTENTPLEIIPDGTRPVLSAVTPDVVAFRDTNVVVIFEGEGFVPETIALSRDVVLVSTFIDSTKLEVLMRDEDFAVAEGTSPEPNYRNLYLSVSNISVGGGQSYIFYFPVRRAIPVPELHSIDPDIFQAGRTGTRVEFHGANFEYGCTLEWNGQIMDEVNHYGSDIFYVDIPDSGFIHGGEIPVRVHNPMPCPEPSNTLLVTITNTAPVYESHTPLNLPAGQGDQTITISGSGFVPDTVVLWNDEELPATLLNSQRVTFTVPESEIATTGSAHFSLFTPGSGEDQTEPVEVFFYLEMAHHVNYMLYDSGRDLIYMAISSEGEELAGKVLSANPATGEILSTLTTGNNPTVLALTADGSYLYVGFHGDESIRRIHLDGNENDLDFPLGEFSGLGPYMPFDIVPLVDAPGCIAVLVTTPEHNSVFNYVMIYDEGVRRPSLGPVDESSLLLFISSLELTSDPLVLLTCGRGQSRSLKEIQITPEGTTVENHNYDHPTTEDLLDIHTFGDLIYSDGGLIFDGQTLSPVGSFDSQGPMTIDTSASQAYFLTGRSEDLHEKLQVFDLESRELEGEINIQSWHENDKLHLRKIGTDGLGFISATDGVRIFRNSMFGGGS